MTGVLCFWNIRIGGYKPNAHGILSSFESGFGGNLVVRAKHVSFESGSMDSVVYGYTYIL